MRRLQGRRLREQLAHARARSPFYRRKLEGVPALQTLDDLGRLPFTTKDELKENQAAKPPWGDLLAVPFEDVLRIHMTSATTGRPLAFLDTRDDWHGFYHSYARALYAFGVRKSDMVMAAFSYGPWIGYWSGFYAAQDLGCLVFPAGGLSTDQRIDALLTWPITVLGCTPSYALFLAVQAADRRCPCGRTLLALEGGVLARLDDMKKVHGIIVYPRRVEELVRPFVGVEEFQILFRRHEGLDDIVVRIDPSPALSRAECDGLCRQLSEALRVGLGIRVTVEATEPGALPRWDHKARRVKDERTEVPF